MSRIPCRGFTLRGTDGVHFGKPHKCQLERDHNGPCLCRACGERFTDPDVEASQDNDSDAVPDSKAVAAAGLITVGCLVLVLCGIALLVRSCLGEL